MAAEEVGQACGLAPRDLGGAEALFHEGEGGFAKGCQRTAGGIQKAGEELVYQGVDAVGGGCLLTHQNATTAGDFADFKVDVGSVARVRR